MIQLEWSLIKWLILNGPITAVTDDGWLVDNCNWRLCWHWSHSDYYWIRLANVPRVSWKGRAVCEIPQLGRMARHHWPWFSAALLLLLCSPCQAGFLLAAPLHSLHTADLNEAYHLVPYTPKQGKHTVNIQEKTIICSCRLHRYADSTLKSPLLFPGLLDV